VYTNPEQEKQEKYARELSEKAQRGCDLEAFLGTPTGKWVAYSIQCLFEMTISQLIQKKQEECEFLRGQASGINEVSELFKETVKAGKQAQLKLAQMSQR
jgi:hypothetical protein